MPHPSQFGYHLTAVCRCLAGPDVRQGIHLGRRGASARQGPAAGVKAAVRQASRHAKLAGRPRLPSVSMLLSGITEGPPPLMCFVHVPCQTLCGVHARQSPVIWCQAGNQLTSEWADTTCSLCKRFSLWCCRYEMKIEAIRLLDFYGGPSDIEPGAYFAARAATTDAHASA